MRRGLVLSTFSGAEFLDRCFEEEGFCVVSAGDVLFGRDIQKFHPPAGVFDGVIGGPPCQTFSPIGNVNRARYGNDSVMPDLTGEFERIVREAAPPWFVMENSPHCPGIFGLEPVYIDTAWLGERQGRKRAFWSNLDLRIETPTFGNQLPERTVCSTGSVDWRGSKAKEPNRSLAEMLDLQGYPEDVFGEHTPFTMQARRKMVGNAVPRAMGLAVARAVRKALAQG